MPCHNDVLSPASLRDWPLPEPGTGKGSRGRALVVGGARATPGAALLAGLGALRVGAGVLTLAVGSSVAAATAAAVPEGGVLWLPETPEGAVLGEVGKQLADRLADCDAVLIGPGLDDAEQAAALLRGLIDAAPKDIPFVLDAYALGVLPGLEGAEKPLRDRLVLTPNTTEVEHLLEGVSAPDPDDDLGSIAEAFGAVISSQNVIVTPSGERWEVPAGHPGLGTSGSGDVLAGVMLGLLARGATVSQAACWGTYLHAAAGDRLAAAVGQIGFLARELTEQVPRLLTEIQA